MATKRKLNTLSIQEKKRLIEEVEKGSKKKNQIAKEFGIPSSTLSTILKNKEAILEKCVDGFEKRKRIRVSEFQDMEKCLMIWITQCRAQNIPLNGNLIKEKAEAFAKELGHLSFKESNGWFENFKNRNNITFLKVEFLPPNTTSKLQPLDQGIIHSFKIKYRHQVVKKLLAEIEEGVKSSGVTILEAMRMTDKVWNSVTSSTIRNCFKKAGFVKNEEDVPVCDISDEPEMSVSRTDWGRLSERLDLNEVQFQDFLNVDEEVAVCGRWEDHEIISQITAGDPISEEDEEEEICDPHQKPTNKEALSATDVLRRFIESRPHMTEETFRALSHLELVVEREKDLNLKQTGIDSFFK
ncbi:tigger transposable element-derived protein 6-like [Uloborus diversus]|uniref:tigger transposable element-derived protein 6-like n=1 Tax=Uloborus diversus TaxID=327109 RepID=UPI002408FDBD|nr:tigger transposable element-derived protein 6-like [Uloborus diversus]